MKKYIFELSLAIGLSISLILGALASNTQQNISDKLIRLHVVANSDSTEDQEVKLKVRDEILAYVSSLTESCSDINEARLLISKHLLQLDKIATSVLRRNGFPYAAKTTLDNTGFPEKSYESFSLPSGEYESLNIKLGNSEGENWWCVLFPPVCISAAEAESEFEKAGLTEKEIHFITSNEPEYKFKFKLVEIIQKIKNKL